MNWLRDHWEIKLIALFLAVTVYLFTGNLIRLDTMVTIRLLPSHVEGLPDGYQVRSITPHELAVEISGPRNLVNELEVADLRPKLEFNQDNLRDGDQQFDVTAALLQLPPELRLRYVGSERVEVVVDRVVRRSLTLGVNPDDFALTSPGLVVRRVQLDHTHVSVEGPKQLIDALRQAGSLGIEKEVLADVPADLVEPKEFTIPVTVAVGEELAVVTEGAITATVLVEPLPDEMPLNLPVTVLASAEFMEGYRIDLHQQEVALTVTGPRNRLEALRPERDIKAYVDLTGSLTLDIPKAHQVRVEAPAWATVSSAQVRLTVHARPSSGPAPAPPDVSPDDPLMPPGVDPPEPPPGP